VSFRNHFSGAAAAYATFRPHYPDALFAFLAAHAPGRALAWDCGTGSGQAALGLARHYTRVLATDASADQIAHATPHSGVEYRVATAERSGLADRSVDLVTAAQALHWFDTHAFFDEVRRVFVPGGVLAVWCYNLLEVEPSIDRVVRRFYTDTVGPFWPAERRLVETGYRTIAFPFPELPVPAFTMEHAMTLSQLGGYVRTWSATMRYVEARGHDPVDALLEELAPYWGDARITRWPLAVRAGRQAV